MNLYSALIDRWGPLPAAVWILGGALGLYWIAWRGNQSSGTIAQVDVPASPISGDSEPSPCCVLCGPATPNRLLGLIGPPGLPAPLIPSRRLPVVSADNEAQ